MLKIREWRADDAEAISALYRELNKEEKYMAGETAALQNLPENIQEQGNIGLFVIDNGESLVGFAAVIGHKFEKIRHRAMVMIGILKDYQNQGYGKKLLERIDEWAAKNGVFRLELTVTAKNRAAMILFDRAGYRVEGMRRAAVMIDHERIDEFYMARLLPVWKARLNGN
ncbi:GNAT family N-acetyltransferase [Terrilactibacillus sp. S3-3]|nr:GNAT family N-acetyltransferase [Terrilactibacillus sp. S3-3]